MKKQSLFISHKYNTRRNYRISKCAKTIQKLVRGYSLRNKLDKWNKCFTCSICFEYIRFNESFFLDNCNHVFHRPCIYKWTLENIPTCPNCRAPICNLDDNGYIGIFYFIDLIYDLLWSRFVNS